MTGLRICVGGYKHGAFFYRIERLGKYVFCQWRSARYYFSIIGAGISCLISLEIFQLRLLVVTDLSTNDSKQSIMIFMLLSNNLLTSRGSEKSLLDLSSYMVPCIYP